MKTVQLVSMRSTSSDLRKVIPWNIKYNNYEHKQKYNTSISNNNNSIIS